MPIYEYECKACGHRLEAIQKISDQPLSDCPECQQPELNRLVSAPSFRLRGGGWYETDFKTGQRRYGTQDSGTGAKEGTEGTKSDSEKPAAKKEKKVDSTAA